MTEEGCAHDLPCWLLHSDSSQQEGQVKPEVLLRRLCSSVPSFFPPSPCLILAQEHWVTAQRWPQSTVTDDNLDQRFSGTAEGWGCYTSKQVRDSQVWDELPHVKLQGASNDPMQCSGTEMLPVCSSPVTKLLDDMQHMSCSSNSTS